MYTHTRVFICQLSPWSPVGKLLGIFEARFSRSYALPCAQLIILSVKAVEAQQ